MDTIGDRLRRLRDEKDVTQAEVAKALGVDRSTLAYWEIGKRDPDSETIKKLANYYNVSTDYLLGRTAVRDLSAAYLVGETTQVPVVGVIRAGEPILATENIIGYETVEKDAVKNGEYFYLKVAGDSMIGARIHDGDLVLVRRQDDVDDGEIAVVLLDCEEATLKKIYRQNGQVILQAENPKYPPRVIKRGDVRIIGKVIEVKFKLE